MKEKWVSNASSYAKHYFYKQILNRPFSLLKQKCFIGNKSGSKKKNNQRILYREKPPHYLNIYYLFFF